MHIPDGYLSPETCLLMYAVAIPTVSYAAKQVHTNLKTNPNRIALLGVGAATAFLIMMFNLPIPGGTSAHAVGGTILAILIGPFEAVLALTITVTMQAFLFGDGGILALGANIVNMAIIMPLFGYACFAWFQKKNHPKLGVWFGSYLGINMAALLVAIELGLQPILFKTTNGQPLYNPYPLGVTLAAMLGTHLLIVGLVEALFSMVIYRYLIKRQALLLNMPHTSIKPLVLGLISLAILTPLGALVTQPAWGEWSSEYFKNNIPRGMQKTPHFSALMPDYQLGNLPHASSVLIIALLLIFVVLIGARGLLYAQKKRL